MREKEKRKVLNRSMREGNINNDKKKKGPSMNIS